MFSSGEAVSVIDISKFFTDMLAKLEKDFSYLKNPSILPNAYEKAVVEIKRRRKFRRVLDEKFGRLRDLV